MTSADEKRTASFGHATMVRAVMLHLLSQYDRLPSPFAPQFWIFGGLVAELHDTAFTPPLQVSGKGFRKATAMQRLLGEAAERASIALAEQKQPKTVTDPLTGTRSVMDVTRVIGPDGLRASTGCAAHTQRRSAEASAISELWERRMVEAWWSGARPAAHLSEADTEAIGLAPVVTSGRMGAFDPRQTIFLWLGDMAALHVAAALSYEGDWDMPAIAFAADPNPAQAFARAFEELLSVEVQPLLIEARGDPMSPEALEAKALQEALRARAQTELPDLDPLDISALSVHPSPDPHHLAAASDAAGLPVRLMDLTDHRIKMPVTRAFFTDPAAVPFRHFTGPVRPL